MMNIIGVAFLAVLLRPRDLASAAPPPVVSNTNSASLISSSHGLNLSAPFNTALLNLSR